ncbi:hypothetical protein [Geodermatophilus sp. SYSU D01119]
MATVGDVFVAVVVDSKGIRSALRHDSGLWLLLRSATPGVLADVLSSWVAEAAGRLGQRPALQGLQLLGPLHLSDGAFLLRLVGYGNSAHLVSVVSDLSATLESAGLDARVGVQEEVWNPVALTGPKGPDDVSGRHPVTAVSVTLPWRADVLRRLEQRRASALPPALRMRHRSDLQEEAWAAVVDTALAWCLEVRGGLGGQRYVAHGASSLQPAPELWEATARLALRSARLPVQASVGNWPGEARQVSFEYQPGRVLFSVEEETFQAPGLVVAAVRELIERLAPHITSAFALRTIARQAPHLTRSLLPSKWAETAAPADQIDRLAPIDDRRIIDAFGVMYLGPGFDGLAADPQMYRVEQLDAGRLLTTTDPDAWFRPDGPTPKPEVLQAARADIADAIVTYDEYRRAKRSDGQDISPLLS